MSRRMMSTEKATLLGHAPAGVFEGKNFMTPNVMGYWKVPGGYAELSTGLGMSRQPIYGVTFRTGSGMDQNGRSKLFQSYSGALEFIEAGAPGPLAEKCCPNCNEPLRDGEQESCC